MTDKGLFIEEILLNSVKKLLSGPVNQLLAETEYPIPPIEFGRSLSGGHVLTPVLRLSSCEQTEKERIIRLDAYTLTITFTVPEHPEAERNAYAYAWAAARALQENPTLGGITDRAILIGKKYVPSKCAGTGADWETVLTLRIIVEEMK
jgi:hypothetical protein